MTSNPVILHLETSTTVCSVSVTRGTAILAEKEINEGYQHSENLHLFIQEVLQKGGVSPKDLQAISLSAGPGSYTGLRIGSSTAKGLCLALNIPFIPLGTLSVLAHALSIKHPLASGYCPMLDAGRMEVYTAVFDKNLDVRLDVQPMVLDENTVGTFRQWPGTTFGGPGVYKATHFLKDLPGAILDIDLLPSARHMTALALKTMKQQSFTQIADFEPFYLKNFVAGKKKRETR